MKISIKECVQIARSKVEAGWTTGVYARDKQGATVDPRDPSAEQFCMVGALNAACPPSGWHCGQNHFTLIIGALEATVGTSAVKFNDHVAKSKEDVLSVFDKLLLNETLLLELEHRYWSS